MSTHNNNPFRNHKDIHRPYKQLQSLEDDKRRHFIGIGNTGNRVLEYFYYENSIATFTAIHTNYKVIHHSKNLETTEFEVLEKSESTYLKMDMELVLGQYNEYIIFVEIGNHASIDLLNRVVQFLENTHKTFQIIAIEPFHFEGKNACANAYDFKKNNSNDTRYNYYKKDELRQRCRHIPIHDSYKLANIEIYNMWQKMSKRHRA